MSPRSTAVLAAVAVVLGAFIWFYEIEGEAERAALERAEKQLFPDLDADSIAWIELETTDGVRARIERRSDRWQLVSPLEFPADAVAVDAMAAALADLAYEQAIEAGQPASVYGLGEAARRVDFGTESGSQSLLIGKKAPLGASSYVSRGGDDGVFTVQTFRTNALSEELLDLRDRRVLAFDPRAVRRIDARWPDGGVVAVREGDDWQLEQPLETAADGEAIDGLLSDLTYLRADDFVDEPLDDRAAGLAAPDFAVDLELAAEEGTGKTIRFELGAALPDGRRLARGSHETLYALGSERIEDFPRELVAYRDRWLSRFVSSEAEVVELVFAAHEQTAGASVGVRVERDDATWTSDPPLRDGVGADMVLTLANLKASGVIAESVGEAERAALGLAPPRARVRVLGRAAESGEPPPVLAEVLFGNREVGRGVLTMRADRDEVFLLDEQVADRLPIDHAAYERDFITAAPEPAPPPEPDPDA